MSSVGPFLLDGNPHLQRLFGGGTAGFFMRSCAPGLGLLLFAAITGVGSIPVTLPDGHSENLGIWWQANWSFMYMIVIPALLYSVRLLSGRIERSITELEDIEVIVPADDNLEISFSEEIRKRFRSHARGITLLCLVFALLLLFADTFDLVQWTRGQAAAIANGEVCGPVIAEMDWTTAFADRSCWLDIDVDPAFEHPSFAANVAFNAYAYFLQTLWAFLALLILAKLGLFFFYMADIFGRNESQFRIEPLWDDPLHRLGLTSLGNIYNLMLSMLLLFQGYVVLHRLQQVALTGRTSILSYVRELTLAVGEPSRWLNPELLQFSTIDVGTWFSILIIGPCVFLICWFPLFKIRNYIEARKIQLTKEYALAKKQAKLAGDKAGTDEFERKARALVGANVWPNGDRAAKRFLYAMIALWIGSFVPMAFIILATLFAVPEILTLLADLISRILRRDDPQPRFPI